ncbi:hypothetical protein JVT61DRAFT_4978 [Boletus reticuloceps]|uniref:Uncharacterized protein n=1 Tax=Boletus reticuloceps TaxID=495285 RepID=A0A8I2Z0T9_9AGAM|nr:hypothetical protein JVT61DRAFT_4978 [Boletus reticuloceps]
MSTVQEPHCWIRVWLCCTVYRTPRSQSPTDLMYKITHDAIYFTHKPSRASTGLVASQYVHVHGVDTHAPPDAEVFPVLDEDMEDGFAEGLEDEDLDDEDPVGMSLALDGQYPEHPMSLVTVLSANIFSGSCPQIQTRYTVWASMY